ncbi:hypothetical protein [Luteococcus sanguinis]|uniref:DUF4232 domain-containing protein n=1 Tax=Luteococcus sanguinis TaxID=174038 RepID=A0ABW1X1M0_9ACTN
MSSIVNPQGPETPDTYWKRRAAVIALAVAALALLWWLLSALFGGSGNDDQTTSAVPVNTPAPSSTMPSSTMPSASTSATPSASGAGAASATATTSASATTAGSATTSPASSASATKSATESAPATPEPSRAEDGAYLCDPADIGLQVTGERNPTAGKATQFNLAFTNSGPRTCRLDFSQNRLSVVVTSGVDTIWRSSHCSSWVSQAPITAKVGSTTNTKVTWPVKRSAQNCTLSTTPLKAGTYRLTASVDGGPSDTFVMTVRA